MPDSFFQSDKKRKRVRPGPSGSRQSDTRSSGSKSDTRARRPNPRPPQDEELSSDAEGEGGRVDIDDMDFRRQEITMSDDEAIDENETAAEKRVRLAKGYLAKVRTELQEAQGDDYDAAEIDRELIASRLQQDVVGHSDLSLLISGRFTRKNTPLSSRYSYNYRYKVPLHRSAHDRRSSHPDNSVCIHQERDTL